MSNLTPYEKKQYLLQKYVKRDYVVTDLVPKFVVYYNPSIEKLDTWKMICVCDTRNEALQHILWKKKYMETGDGDLVVENDPRFRTWKNELLNTNEQGLVHEPTQKDITHDYNAPGNMLQVIANSAPQTPNTNGFKGLAHYTQFDLNEYKGFYKIEEVYEV